jgi:hypothetical protein
MDEIPQGLQDSLETDRGSTVWRLKGARLTTETNRGRVLEERTKHDAGFRANDDRLNRNVRRLRCYVGRWGFLSWR